MDIHKKIQINWGIILSLVLVAVPMFGWKLWFSFNGLSATQALLVTIAKIGAFGGLMMFAVSLILSGRYVFFEKFFGGLDKMYIAHRLFGTLGTILLLIHPIALSLFTYNGDIGQFALFWLDMRDIGVLLGAVSLYGLVGLVVWSMTTKASYETFIKVHRLLGVLFVAGAAHAFISGSVLSQSLFLNAYIAVFCLMATVTFFAYSVFHDMFHRPIRYKTVSVKKLPEGIVEIVLKPTVRNVSFNPGQFIYVSFPDFASQEFHPFSIASGKNESNLRLVVKQAGDFTKALEKLPKNTNALIKGPYGGFTFLPNRHKKQLWIAGGIGVTPFLSGAKSLKPVNEPGRVEMIYASIEKKPYGLNELHLIEQRNPSFNVTHFHQDTFGYVSLELLQEHFRDLHERIIYMCGPPGMMHAIEQEAATLGLEKNLHFEAFSY